MSNTTAINYNIHTSCRDCFFADYDGSTQKYLGCKIHRLNLYYPGDIIECFDEEKEFYVINNNICLFCRRDIPKDIDVDTIYNHIREQIKIRYHLIIINRSDIDVLSSTLSSVKAQDIAPIIVTVINYNKDISDLVLGETLNNYHFLNWRIAKPFNPDLTQEDYIDLAIDGTKQKIKYNFYIVINAGFIIPQNFVRKIDALVNDELIKFVMITPDNDKNGMVVPLMTHEMYGGNSHGLYLLTKIEADLCDPEKILNIIDILNE